MDFKTYIQNNISQRLRYVMDLLTDFTLRYLLVPELLPDELRLRSAYYATFAESIENDIKASPVADSSVWKLVLSELEDAYLLVYNDHNTAFLLPHIEKLIADIKESAIRP